MFISQLLVQVKTKLAAAFMGHINRQQPARNPALAAMPLRRKAGLFYIVLLVMGAGGGFSFGPAFNVIMGDAVDISMGIPVGIIGIVCGLALASIYSHRYQRAYNGWPWLLLGLAAWLGGGAITLVLLLLIAAFICLLSWYIMLLLLPVALWIFWQILRIVFR